MLLNSTLLGTHKRLVGIKITVAAPELKIATCKLTIEKIYIRTILFFMSAISEEWPKIRHSYEWINYIQVKKKKEEK